MRGKFVQNGFYWKVRSSIFYIRRTKSALNILDFNSLTTSTRPLGGFFYLICLYRLILFLTFDSLVGRWII